MTDTDNIKRAASLAHLIRTFADLCEENEYTDTGEAWDLLLAAAAALEAVAGDQS